MLKSILLALPFLIPIFFVVQHAASQEREAHVSQETCKVQTICNNGDER
jgi:hypothetical protein